MRYACMCMHVCSTSSALIGFAASHGKPYNYDHDHIGQAVAQRLLRLWRVQETLLAMRSAWLVNSTRRTTCRTIHHSMQQISPDMLPCLHHELQSAHPAVLWILLGARLVSAPGDRIKIGRKAQGIDINLSVQHILNCGEVGSCHGGSLLGPYQWILRISKTTGSAMCRCILP